MRMFALFFACSFGCSSVTAVGGPIEHARLHNGVFEGSAEHINKATVRLVVEGQRVTAVTLEALDASPFGQKAREPIPRRILEQQSTKVDVISGATEASNIIMNAAEAALQKSYAGIN